MRGMGKKEQYLLPSPTPTHLTEHYGRGRAGRSAKAGSQTISLPWNRDFVIIKAVHKAKCPTNNSLVDFVLDFLKNICRSISSVVV